MCSLWKVWQIIHYCSNQFICLQEGEAEKMGRGGEGIGERKKKSRVAFKHDASGGGGDFCGDGEVKGNFHFQGQGALCE